MTLSNGTRLGPYEILAPLGAGGMGEVYRARDTRLGRDVAIKVLPSDKTSADRLQRFLREARAASQLNHPNVVAIHDIAEHEGVHFIVMEYVDGQTLCDAIPARGWEASRVIGYAGQIVASLVKAHASGIVHRDLKPANIMVTADGVIKVLDFGLAKLQEPSGHDDAALTAETLPGAILGTAAYMSPEQASGRPADARSDIFSLGLVLYEMLTGQRAFRADNPLSTMAAILSKEPRPLREAAPQTPPELERIVSRCLRKEADKRFQSAVDLKLALEDLGATQDTTQATAETPSIAVLPFANLSADKDNEYFSDGLAEEILNALTQLPGLRVIARASAFAFRGREHALAEIGEKLKVQSILQGSVRRAGNRVRVSAQLIQVADESQLWSERYDREMTDVFAIQDEMAQAIVEKLKVKLGGRPAEPLVKHYTENPDAHSLYLRGVFYVNRYTPSDMAKGLEYLQEAVASEPRHARAWVQLAEYHIHRNFTAAGPPSTEMPQALEAAQRALAADSSLGEAHAGRALVLASYQHRWTEALAQIEAASRLPPTAWSFIWGGCVQWGNGKLEEAERSFRRALECDPLSVIGHYVLALLYNGTCRYDLALTNARQAVDISANAGSMAMLGEALSNLGRLDEGVAWLEKARQSIPHCPGFMGFLGLAYMRAGRRTDAERLLAELEDKRRREFASAYALVLCALALGNIERALDWLDTAAEDRDGWLGFLPGTSQFAALRSHPRFVEIMKRVNSPVV